MVKNINTLTIQEHGHVLDIFVYSRKNAEGMLVKK